MTWPERNLTARLLAGLFGSILAAVLGFIVAFLVLPSGAPTVNVVYVMIGAAGIGFLVAFWLGDPAVRTLARLFSSL